MDKEVFFQNGYYIGRIEEIFTDLSLFEECVIEARQSFEELDPKIWQYNHAILHHQRYPSLIKPSEIETRKKLVVEKNYRVFQQLYMGIPKDKIRSYFSKASANFIKDLYPLERKYQYHQDQTLSVLTEGDYINDHIDGGNSARCCGILTYFSDLSDYEKNNGGGELVLNSNIIVPPVKGTFVILDYTRNNLEHGVKKVNNNFKRFTHVNFISRIKDE